MARTYGERMSRTSSLAAALLAAGIALTATGCGDETPTPPAKTPIAEAPSETPTPTAEAPEPFDPTCENIVTPTSWADLNSGETGITPQADFITKMKDEGQTKWVTLDAAGGAVCQVGNSINAFEIYGYAALTDSQSNEIATILYDEGFEVDTQGTSPGQWFAYPDDLEGIDRSWYFNTGVVIFGRDKERVEEILAIVAP